MPCGVWGPIQGFLPANMLTGPLLRNTGTIPSPFRLAGELLVSNPASLMRHTEPSPSAWLGMNVSEPDLCPPQSLPMGTTHSNPGNFHTPKYFYPPLLTASLDTGRITPLWERGEVEPQERESHRKIWNLSSDYFTPNLSPFGCLHLLAEHQDPVMDFPCPGQDLSQLSGSQVR